MSQPRTNSTLAGISKLLSMLGSPTARRSQKLHRLQTKRRARGKKMSGDLQADAMDVDSGLTDRKSVRNLQNEGTFYSDEKLDEQFEMITHETVRDVSFYSHPNKLLETVGAPKAAQQNDAKVQEAKENQTGLDLHQDMGPSNHQEDAKKAVAGEPAAEGSENSDHQTQIEKFLKECTGEMSDILRFKFAGLASSALRQPSNTEGEEMGKSDSGLGTKERQRYEDVIKTLRKTGEEMEGQINTLLNTQENITKHQTDIEERYRDAVAQVQKERKGREDSELTLRSELATMQGACQREKERCQKMMKTMAEMQRADPLKLDNTTITSSVKELRYDIKNWAWAQRFVPSLPAQGLISTYASRALGGKERGPNYDFLKEVTPMFHEYTESPQEFKWLLQAYVWKRIVELVFYDDFWAGNRKPIDEEETEHRLPANYHAMKLRLYPDENSKEEYVAQFHEWRSNSARILEQRISPDRRRRTKELIRDEILRPLRKAADSTEQEIRGVEDLESVIDGAMRLGASLAQQRAFFTFEFIALSASGKTEFRPQTMTEPYPSEERFDPRTHCRMVILNLAPRLVKHGTSEGTGFDTCVQLLEGEVETKIAPKKFAVRRQVV